jgi:hypothetical protein
MNVTGIAPPSIALWGHAVGVRKKLPRERDDFFVCFSVQRLDANNPCIDLGEMTLQKVLEFIFRLSRAHNQDGLGIGKFRAKGLEIGLVVVAVTGADRTSLVVDAASIGVSDSFCGHVIETEFVDMRETVIDPHGGVKM